MKILAIETSCDDTAIAVLEVKNSKFKPLANIVSSQQIHQNYGGVFPMMAKREHQNNLLPVFEKALKESKLLKLKKQDTITKKIPNAKLKILNKLLEREQELLKQIIPFLEKYEKPDVDSIAITHGPGLEPCLWVGVNFARVLSLVWDLPLIPVNHIEAHILVNFLDQKPYTLDPEKMFPALALVVSGGHTQLILVKKVGSYEIIGETRDDAAGECFDKCAKILGLGYPGGPAIARIAEQWKKQDTRNNNQIDLPRPMIHSKDYDFSFSGLKTAVLYKVREDKLTEEFVKSMAFEVQQAIIDVLLKKTLQAVKDAKIPTTELSRILDGKAIGTIILGGGVSANQELRKQFTEKSEIPVIFPESKLSTDNALMIAVAGYFNSKPFDRLRARKKRWQSLKANANLRIGD